MKVCAYHGPENFLIEERDLPVPGDGEIIVKTRAIGVCGTDVHKAIHKTVKLGTVLGHEIAGIVDAIGPDTSSALQVGDRVAIAHHAPCMSCKACLKGHHSLCDQYLKTNVYPGGFSEYIRLPRENVKHTVKKIENHVRFEEAAFMEPLACCLRGFHRLDFMPGDDYLVIGLGPIGMLFCEIAQAFNAGSISGVDLDPYRLQFALDKLHLDNVHDPSGKVADNEKTTHVDYPVRSFDHIIITVGVGAVYQDALSHVKAGTNLLFFAECAEGQSITIDPNLIYQNELSIVGSYSSSPRYLSMALDMITNGAINVKQLVTHSFPLDRTGEAINIARLARESLKVMVVPGLR